MLKPFFLLFLAVTLLTSCTPTAPSPRPLTIPALREWTGGTGFYTFNAESRIVLDSAYSAQLQTTGAVFAQDLRALTGWEIPVETGAGGRPGDIFLSLDSVDAALGAEGYRLEISSHVSIHAPNDAGAFYGTRTMLQLLKQAYSIPIGVARDWPDYPERGLMVDVGRKYYTLAWLKSQVLEMAYLKMNYLHLHFSDDEGFRLESATHPEVVSNPFYTKSEIAALVTFAADRHIIIVPEIDWPGHSTAMLAQHPELQLSGDPSKLDLSQPGAYTLVSDLLDEFLPLFPGPYWHIGADEYLNESQFNDYPHLTEYARVRYGANATGYDAYLGFVNWANGIVKAHGKKSRAWADPFEYLVLTGNAAGLDKDITLDVWNAYENPQEIIDAGYTIQNSSFRPTYYVIGNYHGDAKTLYENWSPADHMGGWEPNYPNWSVPPLHPKLRGSKISIWSEKPDTETQAQVADGIELLLRGLAQGSWGTSKQFSSLNDFLTDVSDPLGHAPDY